jgi:hypothetical protein
MHSVLVERHGEAAAFDFMLKLAVALTASPQARQAKPADVFRYES